MTAVNKKHVSAFRPWAMWLIGTTFVLYQFLLQLSSGVMVDALMRSFSASAFGAGLLSGAYYYIYVALQTPAGMLIDRYGARRLMTLGAFVCALGCWLFASTHQLEVAQFARALMGGGCAFAFVGTLYLVGHWFGQSRFAFMLGMSDMIATAGTLVFNVGLASSLETISWRSSMTFAAWIALTIGCLVWFVVRDSPEGTAPSSKEQMGIAQQLRLVLANKQLWLNGFYLGILFSIVTVFTGMWGVPFIMLEENVTNTVATFLASSVFIGIGIACPFMGWLYPKLRPYTRETLMTAAFICAVCLTLVIHFPPKSLIYYTVIMVLVGVASTVYVFNFTLVREIVPERISTTAMGFTNTLCVITVPIFQPIVGWLIERAHHSASSGYEQYSVHDYRVALSILPLSLAIAVVLGYFIGAKKTQTL